MAGATAQQHDVIIVGGGIWGCAIAYYYIRNNPGSKVLLLERNELCNAATSRAAALITRVRSKKEFIPLSLETYRVIPELESILAEKFFLQQNGVLHVAASEQSEQDLNALILTAHDFNETATALSSNEISARVPWLSTEHIRKAVLMPDEAYCDPYLLGSFFARAAAKLGVTIQQGTEVKQLITRGDLVIGVNTSKADYFADSTIVASGAWAPLLARQVDVPVPMAPVRSQYWITERNTKFTADSPIVILPDAQAYARPESGSLLFGIREKNAFYDSPDKIPADLSNYIFSKDKGTSDLSEVIDRLALFFPAIYDIGLQYYIAGFSGYTPDNYLSMGAAPGIKNLWFATGCVGAGISVCGGVGLAFAEMAAGRSNPYDFSKFDLQRFGNIDPFSDEWLKKCAAARSQKRSG